MGAFYTHQHTVAFCYVLKPEVWMGLLLIAVGIFFEFVLLTSQDILYYQAKKHLFNIIEILKNWHYTSVIKKYIPGTTVMKLRKLI